MATTAANTTDGYILSLIFKGDVLMLIKLSSVTR